MSVKLNRLADVSAAENSSFDAIVERLGELVETGHMDAAIKLVDDHPTHAERLRQLLPTIEALASFDELPGELVHGGESRSRELGDFRIVREIGRGGMGVVYEAEQISLGRRVALKVLPLAAMLDSRRLERFRHEAQAAAMLRHPHIVAVYSVGCERGVHYYAMDLIEGPSLAEVAAKLRAGSEERGAGRKTADHESPSSVAGEGLGEGAETVPIAHVPTLHAPCSTLPAPSSREFFHAVARLGIQAAEALDYAHQRGVVHRDIKPSNLLLDRDSNLWITDFGLATTQSDAGLTMTGDLLGTLRYMSPEQAAGKRLPLDHRTDIYSLGVTLYELLAGRPAFDTTERGELLRSIAEVDPPTLRKLVPKIPADLETIVHKAIEKDAADRYRTAQELADDLRRFSENRAIQARHPTPLQHLRKFGRRHRAATTIVAVAVLLLLLAAVAVVADRHRKIQEAHRLLEASVLTALVGYWPLDGNGADASQLGRDLTLRGNAGFAAGIFGQSLDLHNNQETYAERRTDGAEYDFGKRDFTIQIWVNFYSTSKEQVFIENFAGAAGNGWTFTKPASNVFQFFAGGQYNSAPQTISTNAWHHLVVRRNDRQIQIWFDGQIIHSGYFYGAKSKSTAPLTIGRRNPADTRDFSMDGRLDEVAIWNRALTYAEIAYLYSAGRGNRISSAIGDSARTTKPR